MAPLSHDVGTGRSTRWPVHVVALPSDEREEAGLPEGVLGRVGAACRAGCRSGAWFGGWWSDLRGRAALARQRTTTHAARPRKSPTVAVASGEPTRSGYPSGSLA